MKTTIRNYNLIGAAIAIAIIWIVIRPMSSIAQEPASELPADSAWSKNPKIAILQIEGVVGNDKKMAEPKIIQSTSSLENETALLQHARTHIFKSSSPGATARVVFMRIEGALEQISAISEAKEDMGTKLMIKTGGASIEIAIPKTAQIPWKKVKEEDQYATYEALEKTGFSISSGGKEAASVKFSARYAPLGRGLGAVIGTRVSSKAVVTGILIGKDAVSAVEVTDLAGGNR